MLKQEEARALLSSPKLKISSKKNSWTGYLMMGLMFFSNINNSPSSEDSLKVLSHEFGRFFQAQKLPKKSPATGWFAQQDLLKTVLEMRTNHCQKNANANNETAVNTTAKLPLRACVDLKLLCGDEKQEGSSLLFYLPQPKSVLGLVGLAEMLATPSFDRTTLQQRAGLIQVLSCHQGLQTVLTRLSEKIGNRLNSVSKLFNACPEKDSTNLLHPSFGLFWEDRSLSGFIPKKIKKKFTADKDKSGKDKSKKDKSKSKADKKDKSKSKKSWLAKAMDRSGTVLTGTLVISSLIVFMAWVTHIGSWAKDMGETFNANFLASFKSCFKSNSFDTEKWQAAKKYVENKNLINELDSDIGVCAKKTLLKNFSDEDKTQIKIYLSGLGRMCDKIPTASEPLKNKGPRELYNYFLTPQHRVETNNHITSIAQALHLKPIGKDEHGQDVYEFTPGVLLLEPLKFLRHLLKPAYSLIGPIYIYSSFSKEIKSFISASRKAKQEVADMAMLLKLARRYLTVMQKFGEKNPEFKPLLDQLSALKELEQFFAAKDEPQMAKLIKNLLAMPTRHPGKFLATYKQLHRKILAFTPVIKAFGELEAFLTLTTMANSGDYNFVNYLKPNSDVVLTCDGCIDPKIGFQSCVENSIELLRNMRGMIITGSNAGGKSSYMRTMLQAVILAQTICLVPAKTMDLMPFGQFFTLIGKADDPASGKSLYRIEAEEVANFMKLVCKSDPAKPLLACIDEMFSSTGPEAACKLTRSVINDVARFDGTFALVASHSPGVSKIETDTNGIFKNFKISAKRGPNGEFLGYNRKLLPGFAQPADLTAFDVAKQAGIDINIVEMAQKL